MTWENVQLDLHESKIYSTEYTIEETVNVGDYVAESNFTYDGRITSSKSDTFKIKKGIGEFYRSPLSIDVTVAPGSYNDTGKIVMWLVDACENANVTLNTSTGIPGEWVTFHPDGVILTPTKINESIVNISVPGDTDEGIYNGTIYEYAEDKNGNVQKKYTNLTVYVQGLVLKINVTVERKQICPGESIFATVDIATNHPDFLDVNLTYKILDPDGNLINQSTESIRFNGTNQTNPSFILPADATLGYYTFMAIIEHNSTATSAYDIFEVIPCPTTIPITPRVGIPSMPVAPPIPPTYNITLNLSTNILHVIIGDRASFIATVNNTGTGKVESIRIWMEGIPLRWITVLPYMSDISPGEEQDYLVTISIPKDAEPGVYELRVKATDDIESNTEVLKLIIGRNYKEIADLLLKEVELARMNANRSLLVEECLDITLIKAIFRDAETAYEKALEEYANENYEKSVNWLEYAIPIYEKVVYRVDITIEMEIETSRASKYLIPTIFKPEKFFDLAMRYLKEKNYAEICQPITGMRRLIMMSLIFWPGIIILIIVLVILAFIIYKKKREKERILILERIEKRLKSS